MSIGRAARSSERARSADQLGDQARLEDTPSVAIRVKEEISQKGGLGTAAVVVNTIPAILRASPGFHTMSQIGLPHIWTGRWEPLPVENITYF